MYNIFMYLLSTFFIFILGAIIGSFVNVISLRYNTRLSIAKGRSKCFSCNVSLKWYELLPLISFFTLRGKCRSCKSPISYQYPLVEFITGLVFVGIAWRQFHLWPIYQNFDKGLLYSELFFVYYALVFSLLMVIVIYDFRHKIIPDLFVYTFIVLAVAKMVFFAYLQGFVITSADVLDLATPFILFIPFALLWLVSRGAWIGFGDAKLVFGIGALLGFVYGVGAIVLAFWIGAFVSLILVLWHRITRKKGIMGLKTEIPFAPFLILATLIVFLARIDVLGLEALLGFIY
jgi:leader peptidase (prepilin peptidase)/N-methyltransferase